MTDQVEQRAKTALAEQLARQQVVTLKPRVVIGRIVAVHRPEWQGMAGQAAGFGERRSHHYRYWQCRILAGFRRIVQVLIIQSCCHMRMKRPLPNGSALRRSPPGPVNSQGEAKGFILTKWLMSRTAIFAACAGLPLRAGSMRSS